MLNDKNENLCSTGLLPELSQVIHVKYYSLLLVNPYYYISIQYGSEYGQVTLLNHLF